MSSVKLSDMSSDMSSDMLVEWWQVDLDAIAASGKTEAADLWALSPIERECAGRMRPLVRARYVAARRVLRQILATSLGLEAAQVRLGAGVGGKPCLVGADCGLQFNLSHCQNLALFALARGAAVGIDIERIDGASSAPITASVDAPVAARLAARYFSEAENRQLMAFSAAEQPAALLRGWTRKEALLKALGTGWMGPSRDFTVSLAELSGAAPQVLEWRDEAGRPRKWSLHELEVATGYCAALAVEGVNLRLQQRGWNGFSTCQVGENC